MISVPISHETCHISHELTNGLSIHTWAEVGRSPGVAQRIQDALTDENLLRH